MDDKEKDKIYTEFAENVNMAPAEIEEWLLSDASKSVGQASGDGEAIGHKSGKKIVKIKRTKKAELSEDDYSHMKKVNSYVSRHLAQKPKSDIAENNWRYSLMNWGRDPCKKMDC